MYVINSMGFLSGLLKGIILICMLISAALLDALPRFKNELDTTYCITETALELKNTKAEATYILANIQNLQYHEIHYGGKYLDVVGYQVTFCYEKTVIKLDSFIEEGETWENCDLNHLYYALIERCS